MLLTDFFVQGVERFAPQLKVRLQPGLSALAPVTDDTFIAMLTELFYSEGFDPMSRFATAPSEAVRVGCVITDERAGSFRLIRDLKTASAQLAKAENGQYQPVASGAREVSQRLRSELSVPARDVFETLFVLDAKQFPAAPSRSAPPPPVLMAQPLSLLLPETVARRPAVEVQAELIKLRQARDAVLGIEKLEYELDGLQKKRFSFDELAQKRSAFRDRIAALERELGQGAALDALPADFTAFVQSFAKLKQKYTDDRGKLLDEVTKMEAEGAPPAPTSLLQDGKFLGGIGGGAVMLAIAAFLDGDLRLIGLLDIAPFGLAAVQALGTVNELEDSERYGLRLRALKERVKRLEQKFEKDSSVVRDAVRRFKAESADDVVQQLARRQAVKAEHARQLALSQAFDAGEGQALEGGELQALNERIAEIEAQLVGAANGGDPRDIDRRVAALEAELSGAPAAPLAFGATPVTGAAVSASPVITAPFLSVLRALADASGLDVAATAQQLSPRAGAYAGRLVSRPNTELTLDERGDASFGGAAYAQLPGPEQHALYLSVRLAAYEQIAARHAFPLWIDRLARVADLPHEGLPAFYAHLAKRSQVFLLGEDGAALASVEQRIALA